MRCTRCASVGFVKAGRDRDSRQLYRCGICGRRTTARSGSAFRGYRFPDEAIALAVRWYLRYRRSYADVCEWLAERGVRVDPGTIYGWVRAFTARFIQAARARRAPVGERRRADETYIKVGGRWRYLFRAIDEHGQIVEAYLWEHAASALDGEGRRWSLVSRAPKSARVNFHSKGRAICS
jgi:hypothetical protein